MWMDTNPKPRPWLLILDMVGRKTLNGQVNDVKTVAFIGLGLITYLI